MLGGYFDEIEKNEIRTYVIYVSLCADLYWRMDIGKACLVSSFSILVWFIDYPDDFVRFLRIHINWKRAIKNTRIYRKITTLNNNSNVGNFG